MEALAGAPWLTLSVFGFLDTQSLVAVRRVSRGWKEAVSNSRLFRECVLTMSRGFSDAAALRVIAFSQGQLRSFAVSASPDGLGEGLTDVTLRALAQQTHLTRLNLAHCATLSREAVLSLPASLESFSVRQCGLSPADVNEISSTLEAVLDVFVCSQCGSVGNAPEDVAVCAEPSCTAINGVCTDCADLFVCNGCDERWCESCACWETPDVAGASFCNTCTHQLCSNCAFWSTDGVDGISTCE